MSAFAPLHSSHASTRLSRRSYAVWPRRGVTWSRVTLPAATRRPQYAHTGPCCARSHRLVSAYAVRLVEDEVSCGADVPRPRRRAGRLRGVVTSCEGILVGRRHAIYIRWPRAVPSPGLDLLGHLATTVTEWRGRRFGCSLRERGQPPPPHHPARRSVGVRIIPVAIVTALAVSACHHGTSSPGSSFAGAS